MSLACAQDESAQRRPWAPGRSALSWPRVPLLSEVLQKGHEPFSKKKRGRFSPTNLRDNARKSSSRGWCRLCCRRGGQSGGSWRSTRSAPAELTHFPHFWGGGVSTVRDGGTSAWALMQKETRRKVRPRGPSQSLLSRVRCRTVQAFCVRGFRRWKLSDMLRLPGPNRRSGLRPEIAEVNETHFSPDQARLSSREQRQSPHGRGSFASVKRKG